jgi:hypothetical protein
MSGWHTFDVPWLKRYFRREILVFGRTLRAGF